MQMAGALVGALSVATLLTAQPARAFPPDQVTKGEEVWKSICMECHGPASTNADAPKLLRQAALNGFPTAQATFEYVRDSMPYDNPGTLQEQQYWDVLAFLLSKHGVGMGDAPLGPDTAGGIPAVADPPVTP